MTRHVKTWTDEAIGVLVDDMARGVPAIETAEYLGVTQGAVWTARSDYRRNRLNPDAVPGGQVGFKHKSPFIIGDRILLAKTCTRCGLFLSSEHFYKRIGGMNIKKGVKSFAWTPACRVCNRVTKKPNRRMNYAKDSQARARMIQAITVEQATNNGQYWSGKDDEVIASAETSFIVAMKIHRTFYSVQSRRMRTGITTKRGFEYGRNLTELEKQIIGQWIIRMERAA